MEEISRIRERGKGSGDEHGIAYVVHILVLFLPGTNRGHYKTNLKETFNMMLLYVRGVLPV